MEFRKLVPNDIDVMYSLLSLFGRAFDDAERYNSAQPSQEYLARLLSRPDFIVVAALEGEILVGGLTAYVLPKYEKALSEIYIYDLAVDEPFRRRGIATALIRKLQSIAADQGIAVIYVQADRDDIPAVALYTMLGTSNDVLHFDIASEIKLR